MNRSDSMRGRNALLSLAGRGENATAGFSRLMHGGVGSAVGPLGPLGPILKRESQVAGRRERSNPGALLHPIFIINSYLLSIYLSNSSLFLFSLSN